MTENFREEFGKLLHNTIIGGNASDEEFSAGISPIHNLIFENIPSKLYRYRACNELNFDAFDKDVIWAVSPSKFNDPYDSLFYYDKQAIIEEVKNEFSWDNAKSIWQYVKKHNTLPPRSASAFSTKSAKKILTQYRKISLAQLKKVCTENMHSEDIIKTKLIEFGDRTREDTRKLNKIACFSEDVYSTTMWSHYADYHKGFVLEYNMQYGSGLTCDTCPNKIECTTRKIANLYPVVYSNERYDATQYIGHRLAHYFSNINGFDSSIPLIPDALFSQKAFTVKSLSWEYEKEWRLLCCCKEMNNQDVIDITIQKPTAIYYGTQISSINKKILSNLAKEKGIKEYEMRLEDALMGYGLIALEVI